MVSYATTGDLEARWRPLTDAELIPAATLLGAASRLVLARVPDLDERIAAGTLDPLLVTDVVCDIVRRALTVRFTGAESTSVAVGQVSQSTTYSNPQANLYLTSDELIRLAGRKRRAFQFSTYPVS
jgi:hypothetical protein